MKYHIRQKKLSSAEFITLMALMTSLIALSIDAVMPAFPTMAATLEGANSNNIQLIIPFIFLGLSTGTLFFGPLSDIVGRKTPVIIGLIIYFIGSVIIINSQNFETLILGRILEGFGLAGPRTTSVALTRDLYEGDAMARVMSFIMMVFIMVPIIAPSAGQAILLIASWRVLFIIFIVMALISLLWFMLRQQETLPPKKRQKPSVKSILSALKEVLSTRKTFGYTLSSGMITGAFMGYLTLAQPIFQTEYHMGQAFPLFFASLAAAIGFASFCNGKLVFRYGAKNMATFGATLLTLTAFIFLGIIWTQNGQPPLWLLVIFLAPILFSIGLLFGNQSALAMEPIGHIAGTGSAIINSISSLMGVALSVAIEKNFHNTVTPLVLSFAGLGLLSLFTMQWANTTKITVPIPNDLQNQSIR